MVHTWGHGIFRLLALVILIHTSLCLKASSLGQLEPGKKKVTVIASNTTIRDVFRSIKEQTGMKFFYNNHILNDEEKISLKMADTPLDDVLQKILSDKGLTWKYVENFIRIGKAETRITETVSMGRDTTVTSVSITGKVTAADGTPIPGATVMVKGTDIGSTTNEDGSFTVLGKKANNTLVIRSVGYQPREVSTTGKSILIQLQLDVQSLNETVIKGYYTTTKALNTGNVSVVKSEVIEQQPVGDPMMTLEGRVPGLFISQTSGIPGTEMQVQLRGQNSIANGNDPLYIIDGVPFTSQSMYTGMSSGGRAVGNLSPFSSLRPADIERIEVLKDADATAIYGSRGANGVILITTKKGHQGKTKFGINIYQGAGKVTNKLALLNTEEYLTMRRMGYKNDESTPTSTEYDINGTWDTTKYTDWQKTLIGGTANITDAQATLTGGNTNTQFLMGLGYRKETTVFPGDYNDKKVSAHVNINHKSENGRFTTTLSLSYLNDNNRMPVTDFTNYIFLAPNSPALYNPDGSLNWENSTWQNPLRFLSQSNTSVTKNLNTALNLNYNIIDALNIGVRMGYNDIQMEYDNITPLAMYNPNLVSNANLRVNYFGESKNKSLIIEPTINYNFSIGKGKVETLIGTTFQQSDRNSLAQQASGFPSDELIKNPAAATTVRISSKEDTRYRYNAIYGRIGYNYQNKYLLNLTARRDGSSRFGPGRQFGNFYAIGSGWIFSNENFIKNNLSFLSFGKIRASYGLTGNDQLDDYKYLSTYTPYSGGYQGGSSLIPTSLTNANFGWETVRKIEAGLDIGILKDNILFNVSWYRHRTGNQLVGYSLPDITGYDNVSGNLPAVIQNTGFEFDIVSNIIRKRNFEWTSTFNMSVPRNKLISFPDLQSSSHADSYVEGEPLSLRSLYHYVGVDPRTGEYTFEDMNNDGAITFANDRKHVFYGQNFYGGFGNNFTIGQFKLDIFLQFVKQNGADLLTTPAPGRFFANGGNQKQSILTDVANGNAQKFTAKSSSDVQKSYSLFLQSDGPIVDASYVRLKNVSLSWSIPQAYLQRIKIRNMRIYVSGQNLLTFTKYTGLDPETVQTAPNVVRLPSLRVLTAGIEISL